MLDPALSKRLEALSAFVIGYDRRGRTGRQFWDEFSERAGDLWARASAPDADPELSVRFFEIMADADDAGFAMPSSHLDRVIVPAGS